MLRRLSALGLCLNLLIDPAFAIGARDGGRPTPPRANELLEREAMAARGTFSGWRPVVVGRRVILQGILGMVLRPRKTQAEQRRAPETPWPETPGWTPRDSMKPVPLPVGIEASVEKFIEDANRDLKAASQAAAIQFERTTEPETRERALVSAILISVRALETLPAERVGIAQGLTKILTSESGQWLINHRDLLDRTYSALWGNRYSSFRQAYSYEPVNPMDIAKLEGVLNQVSNPIYSRSALFVQRLKQSGIRVSLDDMIIPINWALNPAAERIFETADWVVRTFGVERCQTPAALQTIEMISRPEFRGLRELFAEPGASEFARRLDVLFGALPVQMDELSRLMAARRQPGFEAILQHHSQYLRFFLSTNDDRVTLLAIMARRPALTTIVDVLEKEYDYHVDVADFAVLQGFSDADQFRSQVAEARRILGRDIPMSSSLLAAAQLLSSLSPEGKEFIRRLRAATGGPALEHLGHWTSFASSFARDTAARGLSTESVWKVIEGLASLGWRPADDQTLYLWNWVGDPRALQTVRALFPNQRPLAHLQDFMAYGFLSSRPDLVARIARLPASADFSFYLSLPSEFMGAFIGQPELLSFFVELHERGLASARETRSLPENERSIAFQTAVAYSGMLRLRVQQSGWDALTRLQRLCDDPLLTVLVGIPLAAQRQTLPSATPTNRITLTIHLENISNWLSDENLRWMEELARQTGYRIQTNVSRAQILAFAADPALRQQAEVFHRESGLALNHERLIFLRDPHVRHLVLDPEAAALRRELEAKGYLFAVRDSEFLYHLARRRSLGHSLVGFIRRQPTWGQYLARLPRVSPDLYEIKRRYFQEQLSRPDLLNQIRENNSLDLANPFTEFGGIFGFEANGDLRLVSLPSRFAPLRRYQNNTRYDPRPMDVAQLLWHNGRYFAFYHNHSVGYDESLVRPSPGDRTTAQLLASIVNIDLLFYAVAGANGRIETAIYGPREVGEVVGDFGWTGHEVRWRRDFLRGIHPPAAYPDQPFMPRRTPSPTGRSA